MVLSVIRMTAANSTAVSPTEREALRSTSLDAETELYGTIKYKDVTMLGQLTTVGKQFQTIIMNLAHNHRVMHLPLLVLVVRQVRPVAQQVLLIKTRLAQAHLPVLQIASPALRQVVKVAPTIRVPPAVKLLQALNPQVAATDCLIVKVPHRAQIAKARH